MPFLTSLVATATTLLPALALATPPTIIRTKSHSTIPNSWIARLDSTSPFDSTLSTILSTAGIESKANYTINNIRGFAFDGDDAVLDVLETMSGIVRVEPDFKVYTTAPLHAAYSRDVAPFANGSLVTQNASTWGLARISHEEAGADSYIYDSSAGEGSYIYVIDTGIYTEHSEFGGRATFGANFIDDDDVDGQGHGTHCAGTAAGTKYGVAKKANLVAVKVLGSDGSGSNSGVLKGIDWAVNNAQEAGHIDRTVLSMSLGGPFSQLTNDAIAEAVAAGAFVAVAAGNENEDASNSSPASTPQACTVAASNKSDRRSSFSNYGSLVDIFAPGEDITSSWIGSPSATNTISGTSMACPHIAGLAAYLIGLEGPTAPEELCSRIQDLALEGVIADVGEGTVNLLAQNGVAAA